MKQITEAKNVQFVASFTPMAGQILVKLEKNGQVVSFLEDTREEALDTVITLLDDGN